MTKTLRVFLLALVAALLIPAAASAADKVVNPGSFEAAINGGVLKLQDLEVPIADLQPAPTVQGTVDTDGNVVIPSSGVSFPPLAFDMDGNAITIKVQPSGSDWTGTIDPDTGDFDLDVRLRIKVEGSPMGIALGGSCYIGAAGTGNNLHLDPLTTAAIPANGMMDAMEGEAYDPASGEVTAVNNTVAVPGATGCGPLDLANGPINDAIGLPSASGNNAIALQLTFTDNAPQPPAFAAFSAAESGAAASQEIEGYVPLEVEFDANASVSHLGPIDGYNWDFDGDGTVDDTTVDPTTSYTYEQAGIFNPTLSVSSDGFTSSARGKVEVTARSIEVTFTETPPAFGQQQDVNFEFEANEAGATFECLLVRDGTTVPLDDPADTSGDPVDWDACESPLELLNLPDAAWTLSVRATSADGVTTGLPETAEFRIDNLPPVTTVTTKPGAKVNYTQFSMGFNSNESGSTFECRLLQDVPVDPEDPGAGFEPEPNFEDCTSPFPVEWQPLDGEVNFEVRATDRAGNVGDPAVATWEFDGTAPTVDVTSGPPSPTNQVGGAVKADCEEKIWIVCVNGWYEWATPGNRTFQFDFASDETVTYICEFTNGDGVINNGAYHPGNDTRVTPVPASVPERACTSGVQTGTGYSTNGTGNTKTKPMGLLRFTPTDGENTLRVWAVDEAGNRSEEPAVYSFIYDTTPPVISVLSKPAEFTQSVNNSVFFVTNEPAVSFECRTVNNTGSGTTGFATGTGNATGFVPCDPGAINPTMGWYTVNGQTEGRKGVQIRAKDEIGNVATTNNALLEGGGTAIYWTVDNTAPVAGFAAGSQEEGSFTNSTDATIVLSATDTPINFGVDANGIDAQEPAYECSLNNGAFSSCDGEVELTGLSAGQQSFRVRVTDAAGNLSGVVERKWTVVDASNASITVTDRPDDVIGVRDATYQFTPDNGTAECRVDASTAQNQNDTGWAACASPVTFTGLADGEHQVEIRDGAGTVPAVENFAVYADLPPVTIENRPGVQRPDGVWYTGLAQNTYDMEFSTTENPSYAPGESTFECDLYKQADGPSGWSACETEHEVFWNKNDDQTVMVFAVRAVSSTGNPGPEQTVTWTISSTTPNVAFGNTAGLEVPACGNGNAGAPGEAGCVATASSTQPGALSNVVTPRFQATSSSPIASGVGFACQLNDGDVHNPCTDRTTGLPASGNPLTVTLGGTRGNNDSLGDAIELNASNTLKVWAVDAGGNMSQPVSFTWTHDNVVPTFAITSDQPARTNLGTAADPLEVDIVADKDLYADHGAVCRLISGGTATTAATSPGLDAENLAGGWQHCTDQADERNATWVGDSLAEGSYALDVRGYDQIWNVATGTAAIPQTDNQPEGVRYVFVIDRTAPDMTITAGPAEASVVPSDEGEFEFEANEPEAQIASVECRLDPADENDWTTSDWTDCADGTFAFDGLADGAHVFQVRAKDTAGNQGDPATRLWTVDTTMPVIDLDSDLPGASTNQTSAEFTFTADPVDSDLECRLTAPAGWPDPNDPAPAVGDDWGPCASPVEIDSLIDGEYTFEVRGTNTLGTVGEPSAITWTVDTVAPDAEIISGPEPLSNKTKATFVLDSNEANVTYECELDGDGGAPCANPAVFTGLADGGHSLRVRATDAAGNTGAWTDPVYEWEIDTVAPISTIDSGPSGTEDVRTAEFTFSVDKAGSTFQCSLDNGSWHACDSPAEYNGLGNGLHNFRVRAIDPLGNIGPAATQQWAVDVPECPPGQVGEYPDCQTPAPDTFELTVTTDGDGNGTVESFPAGIECGTDCSEEFDDGTAVTLTAAPAEGSEFAGWSGACTGTGLCQVTVTEALNVTATFTVKEEPPVEECGDGEIGTWPDCKTPAQPPLKQPVGMQGAYNPATGKLSIKTKCPPRFQKCNKAVLFAVTGQGKKAKFMSKKAVVKNNKGGKAKTVVLTIKPKFRAQVEAMTTVNAKRLFIRIKATGKLKKGKKKGKRVTQQFHHKYKVRVKG